MLMRPTGWKGYVCQCACACVSVHLKIAVSSVLYSLDSLRMPYIQNGTSSRSLRISHYWRANSSACSTEKQAQMQHPAAELWWQLRGPWRQLPPTNWFWYYGNVMCCSTMANVWDGLKATTYHLLEVLWQNSTETSPQWIHTWLCFIFSIISEQEKELCVYANYVLWLKKHDYLHSSWELCWSHILEECQLAWHFCVILRAWCWDA